MHFPGHGSILLGVEGMRTNPVNALQVIWVLPSDLRSPLHLSAYMITDFLADNQSLVRGHAEKSPTLVPDH